jgi:hypothetical protein
LLACLRVDIWFNRDRVDVVVGDDPALSRCGGCAFSDLGESLDDDDGLSMCAAIGHAPLHGPGLTLLVWPRTGAE